MMASVEKPIATHLNEAIASTTLSERSKEKARVAEAYYDEHFAEFSSTRGLEQAEIDAIADKLDQFAIKLAEIPEQSTIAPVPAPVTNWSGPLLAELGPISNQTSRGGADSSGIRGEPWDMLTQRGLTTSRGRWVRMHMISAGYGGANEHGNFIPAPTAINTGSVVRGFETFTERLLYGEARASDVRSDASPFEADLAERPAVIWLKTEGSSPYPEGRDGNGNKLYDAGQFVGRATFKMGHYILEESGWTKVDAPVNQVSVTIDPPDFAGTDRPNINQIGATQLNLLSGGIGLHYASEIIRVRDAINGFSNEDHFIDTMLSNRDSSQIRSTPQFEAAVIAVAERTSADGVMKWS